MKRFIALLLTFVMGISSILPVIANAEADTVMTDVKLLDKESLSNEEGDSKLVNIPDESLFNGINAQLKLGKDKITQRDMRRLQYLSPEICKAHDPHEEVTKVKVLDGVESAKNLLWLGLAYQNVTDLNKLSGLIKLQHLDLRGNQGGNICIENIEPLKNLNNLTYLNLREAKPKNIENIADLKKLEELDLFSTKLTNISFLEDLSNLRILDLDFNMISDITPLKNHTKLEILKIDRKASDEGEKIKSLEPLKSATKLKELNLNNQDIEDLSPLKDMKDLSVLHLKGNTNLKDFSVLLGLPNLLELWAEETGVPGATNGFKTAKKFYSDLNKENLTKDDLDKINSVLTSENSVKTFFGQERIKALENVKKTLGKSQIVNNPIYNEEMPTYDSTVINIPKDYYDSEKPLRLDQGRKANFKGLDYYELDVSSAYTGNYTKGTDGSLEIPVIDKNCNLVKKLDKDLLINNEGTALNFKDGYVTIPASRMSVPYMNYSLTYGGVKVLNIKSNLSRQFGELESLKGKVNLADSKISQREVESKLVISLAGLDSNNIKLTKKIPIIWNLDDFDSTTLKKGQLRGTFDISKIEGVNNKNNYIAKMDYEILAPASQLSPSPEKFKGFRILLLNDNMPVTFEKFQIIDKSTGENIPTNKDLENESCRRGYAKIGGLEEEKEYELVLPAYKNARYAFKVDNNGNALLFNGKIPENNKIVEVEMKDLKKIENPNEENQEPKAQVSTGKDERLKTEADTRGSYLTIKVLDQNKNLVKEGIKLTTEAENGMDPAKVESLKDGYYKISDNGVESIFKLKLESDKYEFKEGFSYKFETAYSKGVIWIEKSSDKKNISEIEKLETEERDGFYTIEVVEKNAGTSPEKPQEIIKDVTFFVTENNLPASQDLTFNFKDLNTNDEQKVTSSNTMITIKLTNGHKYKVSLVSDEKSMKDIEFVVTENGPKIVGTEDILEMLDVKPVKNDNILQGDLSFDKLTVRVLKEGKALNDYNMVLNFFDKIIPNIILKPKTDENGEIELKDFKANSKYEIRTGRNDEVLKFKKDSFTFETDQNGKVINIDGKKVNDKSQSIIIFEGADLNSNIFKKFDVDFKAVDAEGKPMKDIEFSIMMLAPRFTTVQKVKSDVNGDVKFNVEGQKDGKDYSVTLSKMDKFKYSSKPDSMEFKLDDKGNIVMNKLDEKYLRTFVVSKEDRTYIYKEFKDLYEKAKEYLKNQKFIDSKEAKEAIKNLENVIKASEREIEETLPIYAQGKINQLKKAMEDLKAFEKNQVQPEKPHLEESRVERLHGQDRYLTSVEVSKKNFTEAKVVLLANGIKEADALTAAPLADKNKAPILLVNKDEIKEEVLGEIKRLKAEKVIILGGKEAISDQVVEQIEGVEVERIEGKDRFETSVKIAEKLGNTNKLILANGNDPVDALASSALAIKEGRAVLYVEKEQIPEAAKEMGKQAEDILIVGGENAVNKEVEESLQGKTVERLEGKDRFQTATKIAERIKLEAKIVAVASGRSYVDALAYGPVTGKLEATIVLTEEKELPEATRVYLEKTKPSKIYLVGGENRIAEGLVK